MMHEAKYGPYMSHNVHIPRGEKSRGGEVVGGRSGYDDDYHVGCGGDVNVWT